MSYQVLFSGELAEGAQEAAVRVNLAQKLGLDERKAGALFTGRTVVLKSQLKREAAMAMQAELSDMGALVRIKDLSPDVRAKYKIDNKGPDQTLKDITAAHAECARCGHLQLEAQHCARCGVDMRAAMQQQRKEDLLIEKKIKELRDQRLEPAPAPSTKRVMVTENRRSLVVETEAATDDRPNPFGKKKGWLSKLTGRS